MLDSILKWLFIFSVVIQYYDICAQHFGDGPLEPRGGGAGGAGEQGPGHMLSGSLGREGWHSRGSGTRRPPPNSILGIEILWKMPSFLGSFAPRLYIGDMA